VSTSYQITTSLPPAVGAGAVGPYLVPPSSAAGVAGQPLAVWIAQVCAPATTILTTGVTATAPAPTQGDFTLSFKTYPGPIQSVFAVVTVQPTNLYTDSRQALQASFVAFRQQVEALELQASPALIAGGARLLLARVAAALPLRYDEILFYHYGLDPARQCIDLQPGMQLRIENGGYQYCDGPGGPGYALNSYVALGVSRLAITQHANGTLGFDPFTARFSPGYTLSPPPTCPLPSAGLLDLQVAGNARRHLRLLYPATFEAAGSVDNAGTLGQTSCILLGADTYADLEAATADIVGNPGGANWGCGTAASGDNPVVSMVLTGRSVAVPEMAVMLRNSLTFVPVGATLRNMIQQVADPGPTQFLDNTGQASRLNAALWRWFVPTDPPSGMTTNVYDLAAFSFLSTTAAPSPYGDQWDLPLLKGDNLWWHEIQPQAT
jgi:hypothetical protein